MIRTGISGWNSSAWRHTFYPLRLHPRRALEYASRQLSAIEVAGTFHRLPKPQVFDRWHDETPPGFQFALKAPKPITHGRGTDDALRRFIECALHLRDRLGPVIWELPAARAFDPDELERFLERLPREAQGRKLRHVIEARHPSHACDRFIELLRRHGVACLCNDAGEPTSFAEVCADFVYLRLQRARATQVHGYAPAELASWAQRLRAWEAGREPSGAARMGEGGGPRQPRDVYVVFSGGAKQCHPAAAMSLQASVHGGTIHARSCYPVLQSPSRENVERNLRQS